MKSATGLGDDGVFYLVTGRFPTARGEDRDAFLEALGASLVFLIDWNKARKVLRSGYRTPMRSASSIGRHAIAWVTGDSSNLAARNL